MTPPLDDEGLGYDIREGPEFETSAVAVLGGLERWDEIRGGLDWVLRREPMSATFAANVMANFWMTDLSSVVELLVFYEVNVAQRVVTYDFVAESL